MHQNQNLFVIFAQMCVIRNTDAKIFSQHFINTIQEIKTKLLDITQDHLYKYEQ